MKAIKVKIIFLKEKKWKGKKKVVTFWKMVCKNAYWSLSLTSNKEKFRSKLFVTIYGYKYLGFGNLKQKELFVNNQ